MVHTKGSGFRLIIWLFFGFFSFALTSCGGKKVESEPPVAVIQLAETSGVVPFKVYLRAAGSYSPSGSIVSYRWEFPDGSSELGENVSYTFLSTGEFKVSLSVENDTGLLGSTSVNINVVDENDRFTVKGTITSLPFTDSDSDVNDPNAPYADNDGASTDNTQSITNPSEVSGFASKSGTFWSGDRFEAVGDEQDHYSVRLEGGDYVSLFVGDYINADLDLYVYKAESMDLVAFSADGSEYESVQVQEDGAYIVVVEASQGITTYILKIGRSSLVAGLSAKGKSANFAADQIVLKMNDSEGSDVVNSFTDAAQIKTSHRHKHRAMLGRINPLNPQTHNMLWGGMDEEGFQKRLTELNPEAARKLKTIHAIKKLKRQRGVKYAEPNYKVKALLTPNDPYFVYQWHLESLHMRSAWDVTTGDPDVVIAVVDTGVYSDHPDLRNQIVAGYDFVSDPSFSNDGDGIDPDPTDPGDAETVGFSSWHGTHVTGIAVAQINNRLGVVGVAPGVKVMPVRAIGSDGGLMYDVLQAVRYSAGLENDSDTLPPKPADVINLSLGGEGYSAVPQELFKEVRDNGVLVVASSGNQNTGIPLYPASYDGVISVGAASQTGNRTPYSNTGPTLDIMAFGGNMTEDRDNDGNSDGILSTLVIEVGGLPDPDYSLQDGTSMASPQVSGIIALMKSVYPELTPELFDSLLFSGKLTFDKGEPGRDDDYGYGLIDGQKALVAAQNLQNGGETAAIVADSNVIVFDSSTTERTIQLTAIGNGSISIVDAASSEDWVTLREGVVGADGLGEYQVSISAEGFDDGNYRAYLNFTTDQNNTVKVEIRLRVGALDTIGNAGFLYVLLVDAGTGDLAADNDLVPIDGVYQYEFKDIPVGEYYITAGSDVDNNGLVCEYGETCGMYPAIESFEIFRVVSDLSGLDFDAGLYSTTDFFGAQTLFSALSRGVKK